MFITVLFKIAQPQRYIKCLSVDKLENMKLLSMNYYMVVKKKKIPVINNNGGGTEDYYVKGKKPGTET